MKKYNYFFILILILCLLNCSSKYEYQYTKGAASPQVLITELLTTLKEGDVEKYAELIPNPDMKTEKQKIYAEILYQEAKAAGDSAKVEEHKKAVDMFGQSQVIANLKDQMKNHIVEAKKQMNSVKDLLDKKVDYDNADIDKMEVKETDKDTVTCSFTSVKVGETAIITMKIEKYGDAWYFSGEFSSSDVPKLKKKTTAKETSGEPIPANMIILTSFKKAGNLSISGTVTFPAGVKAGNRIYIGYRGGAALMEQTSLSDGANQMSATTGAGNYHYKIKSLGPGVYTIEFGVDMNENGSFNDPGDLIGFYSGGGAVVTDKSAATAVELADSSVNNINFKVQPR